MATRNKKHYLKKSLIWLAGISVGLVIIIGLINVVANTHNEVASVVQSLSSFESIARFVRWGFLGTVIMFWDQIVDYAAKAKGFDEQQVIRAKAMRWRVAAFILAFEFIVIEAVPARLMD